MEIKPKNRIGKEFTGNIWGDYADWKFLEYLGNGLYLVSKTSQSDFRRIRAWFSFGLSILLFGEITNIKAFDAQI